MGRGLDFNPHSPRGERHVRKIHRQAGWNFNPHSPRGERLYDFPALCHISVFQSTLPARGATGSKYRRRQRRDISIHTPREGSDQHFAVCFLNCVDFNPHSPRGERRHSAGSRALCQDFNPHSPRGERHSNKISRCSGADFNPHSPRGERRRRCWKTSRRPQFQSTLPARGATHDGQYFLTLNNISIHTPREGSDRDRARCSQNNGISIHTPREGSDYILYIFY